MNFLIDKIKSIDKYKLFKLMYEISEMPFVIICQDLFRHLNYLKML